jgi:hypothetical protein
VIAAVAAEHQRLAAAIAQRVEHALHEIFEVVGLLENADFLAQAGGARPLAGKGVVPTVLMLMFAPQR